MLLSKISIGLLLSGFTLLPLQSGIELYENYAYYQMAKGIEVQLEGTLWRYNVNIEASRYPIQWILKTEKGSYPIYDPRKRIPLKYTERKVRMYGKLLDKTRGTLEEIIYPARME